LARDAWKKVELKMEMKPQGFLLLGNTAPTNGKSATVGTNSQGRAKTA